MLSDSDAHHSSAGTLYKQMLPNMKEEAKEQQRPSQISLKKNPTLLREPPQPSGEQDTIKLSVVSKKVSNSLKKEQLPVI